jgi:hypothetical protein
MSEPGGCLRIELGGTFDVNWADFFEDMQVHEHVEQDAVRRTTLIGHPRDMEAFLGTLHTLVDWGFPVQALEYRQAAPGEGRQVAGVECSSQSQDCPLRKESR